MLDKFKPPPPCRHLEFIMHRDHLEVVRIDGRTPTMRDMRLRDEWQRYLFAVAALRRRHLLK